MLLNILNLVGLILNFTGTAFVWRFGLSSGLNKEGNVGISFVEKSTAVAAEARRVSRLSNIGMSLILFGFFVQASALFAQILFNICVDAHPK